MYWISYVEMDEPSTKQLIVPTPPPSLATQTPAVPPQEAAVSRLDGPNGILYSWGTVTTYRTYS